jgi:hypothetical protein
MTDDPEVAYQIFEAAEQVAVMLLVEAEVIPELLLPWPIASFRNFSRLEEQALAAMTGDMPERPDSNIHTVMSYNVVVNREVDACVIHFGEFGILYFTLEEAECWMPAQFGMNDGTVDLDTGNPLGGV